MQIFPQKEITLHRLREERKERGKLASAELDIGVVSENMVLY